MFLAICDSLLSPLYALFMIIISHLNPTQLRRYEMHNHLASMSPTPLYSSPVSLILLSSSPSRKSHPPNAPSVSFCSLAPQTTR